MKTISIYSTHGELLRVVSCPESQIDIQIQNGEGYIEGVFFCDEFQVVDGKPEKLTTQPSPHHVFNYTTKQWEDPRTLQDRKAAKWELMKQARVAAIDAPLVTPFGVFDSGVDARSSITDAVLMLQTLASMGQPISIEFTLANNTSVTLTTAQMVNVGLLLGKKVQDAFAQGRARRVQIDAAQSVAALEAVAWPAAPTA